MFASCTLAPRTCHGLPPCQLLNRSSCVMEFNIPRKSGKDVVRRYRGAGDLRPWQSLRHPVLTMRLHLVDAIAKQTSHECRATQQAAKQLLTSIASCPDPLPDQSRPTVSHSTGRRVHCCRSCCTSTGFKTNRRAEDGVAARYPIKRCRVRTTVPSHPQSGSHICPAIWCKLTCFAQT